MTGRRAAVYASVDVAAPVEVVFAAMVELASQDEWMLGTHLFPLDGDVKMPGVGSRMAALTGIGGLGVLDTMIVSVYEPPHRWEVQHTGGLIKGLGIFAVTSNGGGSTVTWGEELDLPLGAVGRIGFAAMKPLVRWGLTHSLRRLAAGVLDGSLPIGTRPDLSDGRPAKP